MLAGTLIRAQEAGLGQGVAKSTWILEMSGRVGRRLRGAESPGARKLEWDLTSHKGYPLLLDTYRPGLQSPSSLRYFGLHFLDCPSSQMPRTLTFSEAPICNPEKGGESELAAWTPFSEAGLASWRGGDRSWVAGVWPLGKSCDQLFWVCGSPVATEPSPQTGLKQQCLFFDSLEIRSLTWSQGMSLGAIILSF